MTEDTQQTVAATVPPTAGAEGRYSVSETGQIFWQENASNPLPGVAVGHLEKGEAMLAPKAVAEGHEKAQEWLDIHIRTVLEPLFRLKQTEGEGALLAAAADVGNRLYDHLGVVHRSDLEDVIPALDADMRKALRGKGVRLGPVLVFLPALVKPAAIRMRALLWALWNGKALPIAKPADGRVSEVVDPAAVDRNYYRMIGYPVFGPRCIRIDMLDRVVTDIYDTAQQGVFEAKHKYAEWLGCGLEDLHAVLESMGHRRYKDAAQPAEGAVSDASVQAAAEAPVAEVATGEEQAATGGQDTAAPAAGVVTADTPADLVAATVPVAAKAAPVVVKFMLKRGKMSDRPQHHGHNRGQGKRHHHNKGGHGKDGQGREGHGKTADKPAAAPVSREEKADRPDKFEKKFTPKKRYDPNRPEQKRDRDDEGQQPRKPKFDKSRERERDREARVYSFEGKKKEGDDDNNPFAILKNLKN